FIRTEGPVFVVEAVAGTIGRGHVKLHEVDVLSNDVGRCAYLKIILFVNSGNKISVIVSDAIVGVRAEEEWFRRLGSSDCWCHIRPQGKDARLREVPACFVQLDVELEGCCFVSARRSDRDSIIVDAWVSERSAGFARQSVRHEVGWCAIGLEARVQPLFVIDHRGHFSGRSGLGDLLRNRSYECFTEVETVLDVGESAASDDVSWQTTVVDRVQRWMWRTMAGDCRVEEWVARH